MHDRYFEPQEENNDIVLKTEIEPPAIEAN